MVRNDINFVKHMFKVVLMKMQQPEIMQILLLCITSLRPEHTILANNQHCGSNFQSMFTQNCRVAGKPCLCPRIILVFKKTHTFSRTCSKQNTVADITVRPIQTLKAQALLSIVQPHNTCLPFTVKIFQSSRTTFMGGARG